MNSPGPGSGPESTPARIPADYAPPADLLAGRVVLVTGAGQGLGRAVALEAARCGATVALLGRKLEKLEATYDAILADLGAEPALVPLDLAAAGSPEFEGLYQVVAGNLARLDAIVHCASHFVPLGPLENQTVEQWMALLKVNLAAPFALTRACLPLLRASADPAVVFTGETHGVHPLAYWGGFAVSKAALSTLVDIWSQELEHAGKPRMTVFVPGPIASPQRAASHPGEAREKLRRPEEAARALLCLLGPEGRIFSGRTVEL
jgi:NAD(P)-dependent dehydrogenase (short-subunit alcohol dehydrogenase family)